MRRAWFQKPMTHFEKLLFPIGTIVETVESVESIWNDGKPMPVAAFKSKGTAIEMTLQHVSISQTQANDPGEDRFGIRVTPSIQAFAVFDGHGGYLACDIATTLLLDMIIAAIESADDELLTNHRYDDLTHNCTIHYVILT